MDFLVEFNLEATRWLQESYPQLAGFFSAFTEIGTIEFYLAFLPLLYWCVSKRVGLAAAYLVTLSSMVNQGIKHGLRDWRPYWVDSSVYIGVEEASYGAPSGHAQSTTVLYLYLASAIGRGYAWLLALLLVVMMAISRVYLGVHDVADVSLAIFIGLLLLAGYWIWHRHVVQWYENRILGQRFLMAAFFPIVLAGIYVGILLIIGPAPETVTWAERVAEAERASVDEIVQGFGVLLGLSIGAVLERSRVRFMVDGPIWRRGLRYVIGLAVAILIWRGLGLVFPRDPLWLGIPLRVLRYLLLGLWAAYYAPIVFVRLKLAGARAEPELSVTL
jgi:membrane-associated phospholipid phosphatase